MESDKGGTTGSSRWNPTKEQINLLEGLYEQGVRTPSADQIQQITARLREYGTIEGKNVFYWFQNHKARQRQKQKQESIAYFNRLLHRTTRLLYPSPSSSILGCGPYYLQQSDAVSYPQSHNALLQTGGRKKQVIDHRSEKTTKMYDSGRYERFPHQDRRNTLSEVRGNFNCDHHEYSVDLNQKTLPLFPLQPTAVSRGREARVTMDDSDSDCNPISSALETRSWHQPYFDFFPAPNQS